MHPSPTGRWCQPSRNGCGCRKLLGKLCAAEWTCIQAEVRRQLGRDDVVPGMIAAIQTHGEHAHLAAGDRENKLEAQASGSGSPGSLDPLACAACLYSCRALPEADVDGLRPGRAPSRSDGRRNLQVLDSLDFLAEFTQHIPPKGSHLIRYDGWYSNKARGVRRKPTPLSFWDRGKG